jgi:FkbM family methyltransferase
MCMNPALWPRHHWPRVLVCVENAKALRSSTEPLHRVALGGRMLTQYLKHLVMNTPLEFVLRHARRLASRLQLLTRPELRSIYEESGYIESACRLLLTPESNTIDVGAHLGSQLAAFVQLARHGKHMAFEPVPHKARWLRSKFPRVDVRETALCDVSGQRNFYVNVTQPGYSGLRPHASADDVMREITIEQSTLDAAVPPHHHVDLIKIDVEGAEHEVLAGTQGIMREFGPDVSLELHAWPGMPAASNAERILALLRPVGYRMFWMRERRFLDDASALADLEVPRREVAAQARFLLLPQGRPVPAWVEGSRPASDD